MGLSWKGLDIMFAFLFFLSGKLWTSSILGGRIYGMDGNLWSIRFSVSLLWWDLTLPIPNPSISTACFSAVTVFEEFFLQDYSIINMGFSINPGYHLKLMVYNGRSYNLMDDYTRGTPDDLGKLHIEYGFVWKCWVNIPNEIAIFHRDNDQLNHWVQWGTNHFQTHPYTDDHVRSPNLFSAWGNQKCLAFATAVSGLGIIQSSDWGWFISGWILWFMDVYGIDITIVFMGFSTLIAGWWFGSFFFAQ